MRTSKLSIDEIVESEKAKDNRQRSRAKGFSKMHERDAGMVRLSNGVLMMWPVPEPEFPDKGIHVYPRRMEEGTFVLKLGNKTYLFDADEFRKSLRWV
jgi:hypothetical protein